MKNEKEIRDLTKLFHEAVEESIATQDAGAALAACACEDVLKWVLGEESEAEQMLRMRRAKERARVN